MKSQKRQKKFVDFFKSWCQWHRTRKNSESKIYIYICWNSSWMQKNRLSCCRCCRCRRSTAIALQALSCWSSLVAWGESETVARVSRLNATTQRIQCSSIGWWLYNTATDWFWRAFLVTISSQKKRVDPRKIRIWLTCTRFHACTHAHTCSGAQTRSSLRMDCRLAHDESPSTDQVRVAFVLFDDSWSFFFEVKFFDQARAIWRCLQKKSKTTVADGGVAHQ